MKNWMTKDDNDCQGHGGQDDMTNEHRKNREDFVNAEQSARLRFEEVQKEEEEESIIKKDSGTTGG